MNLISPETLVSVAMSIPSPSWNKFDIGPLTVHVYGITMLLAIIVSWWWSRSRYLKKGGTSENFETILSISVIVGVIGARVYHVITDYQLYFGPGKHPADALKIWNGGLGIWGAVMAGAASVYVCCRAKKIPFTPLADAIAPTLLVAQAIGRLGNWFNQEIFGGPTNLPWGLEISPENRPLAYRDSATFHPTFLYEGIWNLLGAFVLIQIEKRFRVGRGKLFTLYVAWYTFGRFWLEAVRSEPANIIAGMRVNSWVSLLLFVASVVLAIVMFKLRPGYLDDMPKTTAADDPENSDTSKTETTAAEGSQTTDVEGSDTTDNESSAFVDIESPETTQQAEQGARYVNNADTDTVLEETETK